MEVARLAGKQAGEVQLRLGLAGAGQPVNGRLCAIDIRPLVVAKGLADQVGLGVAQQGAGRAVQRADVAARPGDDDGVGHAVDDGPVVGHPLANGVHHVGDGFVQRGHFRREAVGGLVLEVAVGDALAEFGQGQQGSLDGTVQAEGQQAAQQHGQRESHGRAGAQHGGGVVGLFRVLAGGLDGGLGQFVDGLFQLVGHLAPGIEADVGLLGRKPGGGGLSRQGGECGKIWAGQRADGGYLLQQVGKFRHVAQLAFGGIRVGGKVGGGLFMPGQVAAQPFGVGHVEQGVLFVAAQLAHVVAHGVDGLLQFDVLGDQFVHQHVDLAERQHHGHAHDQVEQGERAKAVDEFLADGHRVCPPKGCMFTDCRRRSAARSYGTCSVD